MAVGPRVTFLRDVRHGGAASQPKAVARRMRAFLDAAETSLDVAIYDFRLRDPALKGLVVDGFLAAADRGVKVRVVYDHAKPAQTAEAFAAVGADPAPPGTDVTLHSWFDGTKVAIKTISETSGHLMHHKYMVRDGAAVWTGSANFTDDAWTYQENNVLEIASTALVHNYSADFNELWSTGSLAGTGADDGGQSVEGAVTYDDRFGPGGGRQIDDNLATLINAATTTVHVASMVLTSPAILQALVTAHKRGVSVSGIYDAGQMDPIVASWKRSGSPQSLSSRKAFTTIAKQLVAKTSVPYQPGSIHDFMHNKVLVIDDRLVATGSHNLSSHATGNAENSIVIHSAPIAHRYRDYINTLIAAYQ